MYGLAENPAEDVFHGRIDKVRLAIAAEKHMLGLCFDPPKVPSLADSLGVSKSTLERAVRHTFGRGAAEHFLLLRMDAAKSMLLRDDKVSYVARAAGFSSECGFRNAFVRITGLTPASYAAGRAPSAPGRSPVDAPPENDCGRYF